MKKILGIDFGERRIGLAVSDDLGSMARSLLTIDTKETKNVWGELRQIIEKEKIEMIVVGLPQNMNGTLGEKGEKVLAFVEELKKKTNLSVVTEDETLSTVEAQRILRETGRKMKKHKKSLDKISAALILQSYLDSRRNE
jgi:putative Holliday junction resolvase